MGISFQSCFFIACLVILKIWDMQLNHTPYYLPNAEQLKIKIIEEHEARSQTTIESVAMLARYNRRLKFEV